MQSEVDFPTIYGTDLVYVPDCWQLCGNAHCCNFSRHKEKFKLIGAQHSQELPLLPGEYEYLKSEGLLSQFGDHDHRIINHTFGDRRLRIETIVSRRPGCACEHGARPTVCRLYPLLPVLDLDGRVAAVDRLGVYDTLETLEGLPHICRVESLPLAELSKFLTISAAIGSDPTARFYLIAYKIVQDHVKQRLAELRGGDSSRSFFQVFEGAVLRQRLFDHALLEVQLENLASALELRHGPLRSLRAA